MLRAFINANRWLSRRLNKFCRERLSRVDGSSQFGSFVNEAVFREARILDIGGGKHPTISPERRRELGLRITGLDIDELELFQAPAGSYDSIVVSDAAEFQLEENVDIIVAHAVAEHVRDTRSMWKSIFLNLAPGGTTLQFIPNRNALFARLNLILPERLKRSLLFRIYPSFSNQHGFRAFYKECSPSSVRRALREEGFSNISITPYFSSDYFAFLFPLHALQVLLQIALMKAGAVDFCESFIVSAEKKPLRPDSEVAK